MEKLWAPIPWMLEAAIVLELVLGKDVEAGIIAVLLVFNAVLGFFQEGRAQATLAALKSRLALTASVCRSGVWKICPPADLMIAATLAGCGWLMQPLPVWILGSVLVGAFAFAFALDLVKLPVFSRLKIT